MQLLVYELVSFSHVRLTYCPIMIPLIRHFILGIEGMLHLENQGTGNTPNPSCT
jgi:hypothetical protein